MRRNRNLGTMSDIRRLDATQPDRQPIRKSHCQENRIAMSPPEIAIQAYNRGTLQTTQAKLQSGQSIRQVQDWTRDELEGFERRQRVIGALERDRFKLKRSRSSLYV
jgi:hypothetical protein